MNSIELKKIGEPFQFEAIDSSGRVVYLDASPELGGRDQGFRPMDLLLIAAAGCCSIDLGNILRKQRKTIENYSLRVQGERSDDESKSFRSLIFHFTLEGMLEEVQVEKDIELVFSKYCSVILSLNKEIKLDYTIKINGK